MKRAWVWIVIAIVVVLLGFVAWNWNSWDDGILYLQDMLAYNETPAQPLNDKGHFAFCKQFVALRNAQRAIYSKFSR